MSVHSMTEQILGHAACCKRLTVGATLVAARPSSHTHPGSCMCITAEKLKWHTVELCVPFYRDTGCMAGKEGKNNALSFSPAQL